MGAIVGFGFALFGALVLIEVGARQVYDYKITPKALVVRLFRRIPIYSISLTDIINASPWTFSLRRLSALFTTLRIGNRVVGRAVLIKRRRGFPRYVVITPDDPEGMIAQLNATRDLTVKGR